jgi:cystathionine gamma-lyase
MMRTRKPGDPLAPPLVAASTYFVPGDPASSPFAYGRSANPTWSALEEGYAKLCGAPSLAFASGMAACAAVVDSLLPRGARIVAPSDAYYTFRTLLAARGVDARLVASTDPLAFARAARDAALVWVETPSNPGLDIVDLEATARACREAGALFVVDDTLATCAGQDPFAFGADVVVVSATKATSGHHDVVLGLASSRSAALMDKLKSARTVGGAIPGVFEAWACLRGMQTLELRLARSSTSARMVAEQLREFGARHPGMTTHPHHALAARQMKHFGPVLTFDLGTQQRAEAFCARLEGIVEATSFGGNATTLERRARWGGDAVSPGLIRMSVGLEDPDALVEEVRRAIG